MEWNREVQFAASLELVKENFSNKMRNKSWTRTNIKLYINLA